MAILYGKIRIYANPNTPITLSSVTGSVNKLITVPSGKNYVDALLPGLDEYVVANGSKVESVLLNYGDFVEVTL